MHAWPHAPLHRFNHSGVYFITAGTLYRQRLFHDADRLDALQNILFANAHEYGCLLQAWALMSNHYHLVVASEKGEAVREMLIRFHVDSAIALNRLDGVQGRKVWFQFRDSQLTYERSWLARLKYTHENAVHHRLVVRAVNYPWCSAAWFEGTARPAFVETVRRLKIDRVRVYDEY